MTARSFDELRSSGLLWLLNRTVLHPRGFAFALDVDAEGSAVGWHLIGDGSQPLTMDGVDENEKFLAVESLFAGLQGDANASALTTIFDRLAALEGAGRLVAAERAAPATPVPAAPHTPAAEMEQTYEAPRLQVVPVERPSDERPVTIAIPLSHIQRSRPAFMRASFAASHRDESDIKSVSDSEGNPTAYGVRM